MSIQSIDNFRSAITRHNGIAKSERFSVQIYPPAALTNLTNNLAPDLMYQCEAAELPGVSLITTDYRTVGPSKSLATMTTYNELSLSFYCTSDFYEKPFFEAWIEYINPRSLGWDFRYKSEYATTLDIFQYDLTGDKIIYVARLIRAYPIAVHALPLHWQDDSVHRLSVLFKYDRFDPLYTYQNMFDKALALQPALNNGLNAPNPLNTNNNVNQNVG